MKLEDTNDQLIAYVEGQLSPDERTAFERTLAGSPALQRKLTLMRRIDDSLVHSFAAPGFVKVNFEAGRAAAAQKGVSMNRWIGIGIAAVAAALLVVVGLQFSSVRYGGNANALTVSAIYDGQVKSGFVPQHVCKDDADFVDYSTKAFGLPLLAQSDASVQIVGWNYIDAKLLPDLGLSAAGRVILARVDGKEVVLLLDKSGARGPKLDAAAKGRLNLFEKNVGGVEVFEITPLDKPAATERFSMAGR